MWADTVHGFKMFCVHEKSCKFILVTLKSEQNTKTYLKNDGDKRIEYYHADGRPHMVEDYDANGNLTMLQRYYYRDIRVPAEGGKEP